VNRISSIKISLEWKELKGQIEGTLKDVRMFMLEFLGNLSLIEKSMGKSQISNKITVKEGSLTAILLELRNEGFFDNSRTTGEIKDILKERFTINVSSKNLSVYLRRLVRKKILNRKFISKNKAVWFAPWVLEDGI